ncbi:LysR family transcriptional regulator [Enterocloster lavalensis]|uniref:LysR family transcriptional regulator n=1 Tax=Enterocloster lavalensis TaxID=460384 RepID=UPI0026658843|nr:LysR family transcriptional regulator [Enterocloster lavalensis]
MTLRHLRIFLTVCEAGSMTGAANRLFTAQPSVSLAIREMEEYYGVKLFDRISKKLFLTEAGHQVLEYARHIIALFDEMEQEVRNPDMSGTLRVGTSITVGTFLLPGYVKELTRLYPELRVEARIENSNNIEKCVLSNEIDLGVIEGIAHSRYINSESFHGDRLAFVCPPGHRFAGKQGVKLGDLQSESFILREKGSAGREIFDGLAAAHELDIRIAWQSTSNQAIIHGVAAGFGLSVLPASLAAEGVERGSIAEFTVEGLSMERKFCVIYHKNKFLVRGARELIRLFKEGGEEKPAAPTRSEPLTAGYR